MIRENIQPIIEITIRESEKAAFIHEQLLIASIGRADLGYGPLTNKTDGGDSGPRSTIESGKKAYDTALKNGTHSPPPRITREAAKKGAETRRKNGFDPTPNLPKAYWTGKKRTHMNGNTWAAGSKGQRWITNGTQNRKLKPDLPMPDGWHFGKTYRTLGAA